MKKEQQVFIVFDIYMYELVFKLNIHLCFKIQKYSHVYIFSKARLPEGVNHKRHEQSIMIMRDD